MQNFVLIAVQLSQYAAYISSALHDAFPIT